MIRLLTWTDEGALRFHEFESSDETPAYAILSHTWNTNNKEEVSFEDLETGSGQQKTGYSKIDFCKKQASVDEIAFIWIDTCCINRRSEPELSEAINSMFRWYKNATRCYVYLSDVSAFHEGRDTPLCGDEWEAQFLQSRWFTRGWTLQELIAPEHVEFFARDGTNLGNKLTLETAISNATGISLDVLRGRPLAECTVGERLTWAIGRTTKREEDHVYSLFGIFDLTMPLIYGEGKGKAFRRFYEEISKYTPVHVIFPADATYGDATQELINLRSAMQKLEARLTTSLITQGNSLGLQWSSASSATYQSTFDRGERLSAVTNATGVAAESTGTNYRSFIHSFLLKLTQLLSTFTSPLSYFETWSSFRPEAYTIYDIGPQLICYTFAVTEKHPNVAVATYNLLVAKTQRHWIRVTLRMTLARGTTHWKLVAEQKPKQVSFVGWRQLPDDVISLVGKVRREHLDIDDDTEINIRFDKDSDTTGRDGDPKATSLTRRIDTSITGNTSNFTESLRHQNVRVILETTLVTAYNRGIFLVANLENLWVLYRPILVSKCDFDHIWHVIQAHVTLRGSPYVAQMAGVVVDLENKLKGILVELPSKGPMFQLMDAHRLKSRSIPWPIRQKWAKQIARGLTAYHERRHFIAGFRTYNCSVCIDDCDNVMIMGLSAGGHPAVHGFNGLLPPEYRTEVFEKGDGQVGFEFDIFQLGILLWHLYRDQHQQGPIQFCSLAGCNNVGLANCDEHKDPIALPKAAANSPDYLDRIIALCRQEDPRKRPTAREVVDMFPEDEEITRQINLLDTDKDVIPGDGSAIARLRRLEVVRDLYANCIICTLCRERCYEIYYKCEICEFGNYDQCHECLVKGRHCYDRAHLLAKFNLKAHGNKALLKKVTYYSSLNDKGGREEIVI